MNNSKKQSKKEIILKFAKVNKNISLLAYQQSLKGMSKKSRIRKNVDTISEREIYSMDYVDPTGEKRKMIISLIEAHEHMPGVFLAKSDGKTTHITVGVDKDDDKNPLLIYYPSLIFHELMELDLFHHLDCPMNEAHTIAQDLEKQLFGSSARKAQIAHDELMKKIGMN